MQNISYLDEIIFYKVYYLGQKPYILELRENIMLAISFLSVGCKNIVLDIDFCKPKVIQGLDLNFNLHLLNFLRGAQLSNNMLILFKYILVELSALSSSIFNNPPSQQKNSLFLNQIWTSPCRKYWIYCLRYYQTQEELLQIEADDQKW